MHVWLLLLSVTVLALVLGLGFVFSKSRKKADVWRKLESTEVSSAQTGDGSQTEKVPAESADSQKAAGKPNSKLSSGEDRPHELWVDSDYCWVVVCKNSKFHTRDNPLHAHRIPLAWTDAVTPRPVIGHSFAVRCDDCGGEYNYDPSEVLKFEEELPESFTPHPLFRLEN
jgi:hypothetical protein